MTRRQYAGGASRTVITGAIASSGGGTVVIANGTGWPDGSIGKFHVVVDPGLSSEEKILVDFRVGTTLTFSPAGRGADGTAVTSHSTNASIWHCLTAVDADEANAHINQASGSHTASQISYTPGGTVAGTNLQTAVAEVASEIDARVTTNESAIATITADNWVTQARMADNSVGTAELFDDSVVAGKMATTILAAPSSEATVSGGSYITWESETSDPDALTSFVTTVVTIAKEGTYLMAGKFTHSTTLTGVASLTYIEKNGANTKYTQGTVHVNAAGNGGTLHYPAMYFLAGETFKLIFAPNVNGNTSAVVLHVTRISSP